MALKRGADVHSLYHWGQGRVDRSPDRDKDEIHARGKWLTDPDMQIVQQTLHRQNNTEKRAYRGGN
jgi:hypothetical protein